MNMIKEMSFTDQSQAATTEVAKIEPLTIAQAEALAMYGILERLGDSPMMDKGDRRKKKKEKQEGTRPPSGPGSKGSSKSELDSVIFEQNPAGVTEFGEIDTLDFLSIAAELNGMSAMMQKKEHKKNEHKERKNKIKGNQQKKIEKQG